ncbi:hypothetical protein MMC32_007906 [Xylographa parallela]|nr:hypothetical protein [Xylographa parallela]
MQFHTTILLLSALGLIVPTNAVRGEIPVQPLLDRFRTAIRAARGHMYMADQAFPQDYDNGGGCYTGFGTTMALSECRAAIARMPAQHPDVDDITEGFDGPILTRTFHQNDPMIWKDNDCLIGVSLLDVPTAKGLYPLFKEAAQLIFDNCVIRSRGGMVRFAHFEVVLFDAKLLPGYVQGAPADYIHTFSSDEDNIPFSMGLVRIDQNRGVIQQGFDVGDI